LEKPLKLAERGSDTMLEGDGDGVSVVFRIYVKFINFAINIENLYLSQKMDQCYRDIKTAPYT
jgi:hypothetical protein